jgi:hypothetical protein
MKQYARIGAVQLVFDKIAKKRAVGGRAMLFFACATRVAQSFFKNSGNEDKGRRNPCWFCIYLSQRSLGHAWDTPGTAWDSEPLLSP